MPFSGVGNGTWEAGVYDFKSLPLVGATEFYDEAMGSSYSYDAAKRELITYDTVEVAKQKASWIKHIGLGGAMWWESSADKLGNLSLIQNMVRIIGGEDGSALENTWNELSYPNSTYGNLRAGIPDLGSALSSLTERGLSPTSPLNYFSPNTLCPASLRSLSGSLLDKRTLTTTSTSTLTVTRCITITSSSGSSLSTNSSSPSATFEASVFSSPRLESLASTTSMLTIVRMTMVLLDLALVFYTGSHGSRFGNGSLMPDIERIDVLGTAGDTFSFRCSLQPLACLDGFLDSRLVWIFECYSGNCIPSPTRRKSSDRMLLLTRMDAFADVWGPVWSVPAGPNDNSKIKQYNVSKGVICAVSHKSDALFGGAIRCHWYNWASFYMRHFSNIIRNPEEILLAPDDLLLIGGPFIENWQCGYKLQDFEEDYCDRMTVIGTTPECWRLESRSLALGFSKLFGVVVTGVQKKIPQTTLKQHILDKWSNKPTRASPGMLNLFVGLEISHCTGNARRVSVKNVMLMEKVQPLLERQHPEWSQTPWGKSFQDALVDPRPQAIFDIWKKTSRSPILHRRTYTRFTAGVFNDYRESAVTLDHRANNWTTLLMDSHLMATFAVVNEICLECRTPNHSTATCKGYKSPSVLQTQLAIEKSSKHARVKLNPCGQVLKKVDAGSNSVNLYALESALEKFISTSLNKTLPIGVERQDQTPYVCNTHFHIRASTADQRRIKVSNTRQQRIHIKKFDNNDLKPQTPVSNSGKLHDLISQLNTTNMANLPKEEPLKMSQLSEASVPALPVRSKTAFDDIADCRDTYSLPEEKQVIGVSSSGVEGDITNSHKPPPIINRDFVERIASQRETTSPILKRKPNFSARYM